MKILSGAFALVVLSCVGCSRDGDRGADSIADRAMPAPTSRGTQPRNVVVNGVALDSDTLTAIETRYRVRIADSRLWYDDESGLFGGEARPPTGFFVAGLHLGGPLRADASDGNSGI